MSTPLLNIGGLASGLDTNAIVDQLMQIERLPRTRLDQKASLITARQSVLADFQSRLRAVESAAQGLRSIGLWSQAQTASTSDATRLSAAIVSGSGAGVGGYQVEVSQLANAAQRTYSFVSPASAGTITIDGHDTAVAAGASLSDVVSAINSDARATVYAAATDRGTLVLSARTTGDTGTGFIALTDGTGSLTEQTGKAKQGRDAQFTVDGVAGSSSSNEVTNAIAGVRLSLRGVTTVSGPITVTVGAPTVNTDAVKDKLRAFVDVYNSTVDAIRAKLDERSVKDPKTTEQQQAGMLNGDTALTAVLSQMRQMIYSSVRGLPDGMSSLADLGVSTGSASATISRDALAGKLEINSRTLDAALASNATGVRDLLAGSSNAGGWARGFERIVHGFDTTGGTIDVRITGADAELKRLQQNMADMDQRLALKEQAFRAQFAAMESALAQSQAQGSWLSGQLASLNNN
ncbi:MAG TPA: flagellar filament capping protein FliD [Conexibacter sp.]|nr:flagellar filament capping protein FliD [Conexibacter sp.]